MSDQTAAYKILDGSKLRVGIVISRWNFDITEGLLIGALQALTECKVKEKNISVLDVTGSYELPFAARKMMQRKPGYDVVLTLGCLIKGQTMHFEYIADAVAHGIMELNVDEKTPVIFGVLTCLNQKQAKVRSQGKNNHGYGWGMTAVEMALLK